MSKKSVRTDVALANLLRNLNVRTINRTKQQSTVQAELHVRRAGCFRAGRGNVLTEVRRRDEDLGEGDGVVGNEEHGEVFFGVRIDVDDAGDVDDEFDGLEKALARVNVCTAGWTYELRNVVCKRTISISYECGLNKVMETYIPVQPCQQRIQHEG
jgi:hypothetical protein